MSQAEAYILEFYGALTTVPCHCGDVPHRTIKSLAFPNKHYTNANQRWKNDQWALNLSVQAPQGSALTALP